MRLSSIVLIVLAAAVLSFAVPAMAVDSFFDIFTDITLAGTTPLPALDQGIGHIVGGAFQHDLVHHTQLRHFGATPDGGQMLCQVSISNGLPPGPQPAIDSFFDVFVGDLNMPTQSFFDVFCDIEVPSGGHTHLVPLHPPIPNSFFDVFVGESFFDITYRVEVGPGGGCHELHMHATLGSGMILGGVQVSPSPVGDSFFDVFFDVFKNPGPPSDPIVHVTTTGEFVTGPLAAQLATWGFIKSLYQ